MWPPWTTCLMPFTRPRLVAWEWGLRSVRRSSNATADGCGLHPTPLAGPYSGSGCRPEASPHDNFADSGRRNGQPWLKLNGPSLFSLDQQVPHVASIFLDRGYRLLKAKAP
jgi:hypothetical protein